MTTTTTAFDRGEVHGFCSVRYDQPAPADCAYPEQHIESGTCIDCRKPLARKQADIPPDQGWHHTTEADTDNCPGSKFPVHLRPAPTTASPKLTAVDQATVARVTQNHGTYLDLRHDHAATVNYASWAGIFEVNIEELLEIIDRLTGTAPAPDPLPKVDLSGLGWPA